MQADRGAGAAAAQQAATLLGKMGMASIKEMKPGEVPTTKEFTAKARIRHTRSIVQVAGGTVPDYMSLPVDQYAIYDSRLMRRLPEEEGGDGDIFELTLPSMRPQPGTLMPEPKLRVRVTPGDGQISLESLSASLFSDEAPTNLPTNVTSEQLSTANDQLKGLFNLAFNTTLSWVPSKQRGMQNATNIVCRTDVRLKIRLPPPFTRAPRPLVQGAIGIVMRFVGNAILPRFAALLESDYGRWCNGTRDLSAGLGSLTLDQDGYVVVPDEVVQKMKQQQQQQQLRQRQLAEAAGIDVAIDEAAGRDEMGKSATDD